MKKVIRITESKLNKMIGESVKKILKEGSPDEQVGAEWDELIDELGSNAMLDELFAYLNEDTIKDFIETAKKNHDLDYEEDEDDEYTPNFEKINHKPQQYS